MKKTTLVLALLTAALLLGCGSDGESAQPSSSATESAGLAPTQVQVSDTMGHGPGMGPGSGMMDRHHATVPAPYAGLTNPITADVSSLERGGDQYSALCASCHGDGGMGDGPAGVALDPAPAPVAHTSQMLGDDLLFWRLSEGGAMEPFSSAMPAWKDSLDEQTRWDLISYMRALGRGDVAPRQAAGGEAYDPEFEKARRTEMLARGVEEGVITQTEAALFEKVHDAMDELAMSSSAPRSGGMDQMRITLLDELVRAGTISQQQADAFRDIHDRLEEAGLME